MVALTLSNLIIPSSKQLEHLGFTLKPTDWKHGAHGFGVQLIPQYPVVNQSVTLRVTGVAGTILQFWWYKGSSVDTNSQIFSVIPFPNSMTPGPQYFHRASQFPNGSLQISSLIPTDQGNFALMMLTAQGLAKVYIYLPVHGKYSSLCNSFIIIIRSPSWFI
ncbi:hypothetical protein XENTR_v10019242 [Xenopus tropicalis]|nr:hypothetical protein XENTR_v10019242 [Xenopus tropicalis]